MHADLLRKPKIPPFKLLFILISLCIIVIAVAKVIIVVKGILV